MYLKVLFNVRNSAIALAASAAMAVTQAVSAAPLYSQGFETDIAGWDVFGGAFNATRVSSGTNGITSASGAFHAEGGTPATNWGGYNYGAGGGVATVFQPYLTSVDVFLDLAGGWANDTRFDFSSAINNGAGDFMRDFVFNGGFYDSTDVTGPGAGTNRFVFSASNNAFRANSFPKNPGRAPVAISTSGWYTFTHSFYENAGVLAADLNIADTGGNSVGSWTLSAPTDLIAGVGGNRYGWFASNEFQPLAFDNTSLTISAAANVPAPATLALLGLSLAGLGFARRRKA